MLTGILEIKRDAVEMGRERLVQGEPIRVHMIVINDSDTALETVNPEVGTPPPALDWKDSNEAYRIAVLMSFGLIEMTLKDAGGRPVESKRLMPWVTPILGKRTLQPHQSLVLDFDLTEFFSLDSAGLYNLRLRYGNDQMYAQASTDIEIGPR